MGQATDKIEEFIAAWRETGGSELANTQSFINGLCDLIGVPAPDGSKPQDSENDYVFERRVFADNGDGTTNFGRIDCYRRGAFILEAKQGSDAVSRRVTAKHLDAKKGIAIAYAIPNHPWVDEKDGAAVRIAMTVGVPATTQSGGLLRKVSDESGAPDTIVFTEETGRIGPDLRVGADVTKAVALKANARIASRGVQLMGSGFIVTPEQAERLDLPSLDIARGDNEVKPRIRSGIGNEPQVIFDYRNGKNLMARPRGVMVIDTYGLSETELRERHPAVWQHIHDDVKPHRDTNNRATYRDNWWLFGEQRNEIRKALRGCERYIATVETAKHRVFQFLPITTVPDNMIVAIASADAFDLGVLSSRSHLAWVSAMGGTLEDRPRYTKSQCFDPFPFPTDVPEALAKTIRSEAEALDALRKRVLADHDDLTLTKLYNVLEALRSGRVLTGIERDIHDRGLVTLISRHHDAIDAAVAQAYGWPADLPEEEILTRLVALNRERAAEETRGLIRYLRPEFQDPGYQAPINETLDLGETVAPLPDNIIAWPKDLPAQIGAVQSILSSSPEPLAAQDIARAFKGKRAATVRPVLDALTGVGLARRTGEGKYAA